MNSYRFFANKECEWYPCHSLAPGEELNCLFCYCPLSPYEDCGGNYVRLSNGWKDCSDCLLPHRDYDYVISKLVEKITPANASEKQ